MSNMLHEIHIENFRSIEDADIKLAPITVFYGHTAAGKSSVLYALYAIRNFLLNPNQAIDGFFQLGFQSLGGFEQCIFNHDNTRKLSIKVSTNANTGSRSSFGIALAKSNAELSLDFRAGQGQADAPADVSLSANVTIPYPLNQTFAKQIKIAEESYNVNWNGINCSVVPLKPDPDTQKISSDVTVLLNQISEEIKRVDIVPHKRGFFKAAYTAVQVSPNATTDDEVASLIINDPHLAPKVSMDTDEIFGRDFRTQTPPGTATVYLMTTEKKARTPAYIVNDGFGVNQVIYMLAKIYRSGFDSILIEEPEVHLHPTIIRNLARRFCQIVQDENKQLIFTTHSEHFLTAILGCVAEGTISNSSIKCYHALREKKATHFTPQAIQKNGQIEGGLSSFIEAEVSDLKSFLKIQNE